MTDTEYGPRPEDTQVNVQYGGRILYWNEPDGHQWEMLTVSYARREISLFRAYYVPDPAFGEPDINSQRSKLCRKHIVSCPSSSPISPSYTRLLRPMISSSRSMAPAFR